MKTICFDFDNTIHSYKTPYTKPVIIPDEPVPGAKEFIAKLRAAGFRVVVLSTRCAYTGGVDAVKAWLRKYEIIVDDVVKSKPPAVVYIDDRGLTFKGKFDSKFYKQVVEFEPYSAK